MANEGIILLTALPQQYGRAKTIKAVKNKIMDIYILTEVITGEHYYYIVEKKSTSKEPNPVMLILIPEGVEIGKDREEIMLLDLEIMNESLFSNIYLNEEHPPFQWGQSFSNDIIRIHPVTCNIQEFLKRSLNEPNTLDFFDYKKMIGIITKEEEAKQIG